MIMMIIVTTGTDVRHTYLTQFGTRRNAVFVGRQPQMI